MAMRGNLIHSLRFWQWISSY